LLFCSHELLLFEALREGLEEEMERDARVCVIGEDVGHYGGSYKVTKGLADKYGDLRVLDTPIAENSFTGMGIGAAMTGLRPIIEGMNMGFLLLAFNQISNNCGMLHYTSGGQFKIPVVIRGPGGVGRQLGAEHSQRLESYFQSIPGIQMVACSTPYNAKGLMKAAIRSDNPVILFEHVLLYNLKERIPDEEYAAKTLVNKGYDPEVIDIRSLKPFDLYKIGNSIKKTHRVLIVEECMRTGGIGASLTAAITENFNDYLDAPIMCLSSQDVPTPYAGTLEEWTVVQPPQIVAAVEQLTRLMVLVVVGVGRQLGAEHSQRLESYFQSIPGIQMVACSTPYNAKGLMKAAIRSDNPVILFEHVLLYNLKERIPDEEYVLSLEEAEMVRPGEHVTILTYSRMRYHVMQAAKTLVNKGYDPEVIDIRQLPYSIIGERKPQPLPIPGGIKDVHLVNDPNFDLAEVFCLDTSKVYCAEKGFKAKSRRWMGKMESLRSAHQIRSLGARD
nr:pyruvate dehydrogenase E1 component subunit beta-3, chloroplastic-like [Tanacetum cinerariifolium]